MNRVASVPVVKERGRSAEKFGQAPICDNERSEHVMPVDGPAFEGPPDGSAVQQRQQRQRAGTARYRERVDSDPITSAAKNWAIAGTLKTRKHPISTDEDLDKVWRTALAGLYRAAAASVNDSMNGPTSSTPVSGYEFKEKWLKTIDIRAKSAAAQGVSPRDFRDAYLRENGWQLPLMGGRGGYDRLAKAEKEAAEAMAARGPLPGTQGGGPPQAEYQEPAVQQATGHYMAEPPRLPQPYGTPAPVGRPSIGRLGPAFDGGTLPPPRPAGAPGWAPPPRLPPVRAYLPGRPQPLEPAPGLRSHLPPVPVPFADVLPRPVQGGSGVPAPYAPDSRPYGPPPGWQPQGPAQGPPRGRAPGRPPSR
ncbi:hypothetical protein GCM10009863_65670 [Streptomyces axinellae]|uniref:Uncharacterized protein n=1 Tax=Streptomyces axinellae TaxID=552788 RepID=A0ABN3R0D2_9ACTN